MSCLNIRFQPVAALRSVTLRIHRTTPYLRPTRTPDETGSLQSRSTLTNYSFALSIPQSRNYSTSHHTTTASQPTTRLQGTTCMVTGGSSGIGYAIAQRFLREGAKKIILVGRSRERLENAVKQLGSGKDATTSPKELLQDAPISKRPSFPENKRPQAVDAKPEHGDNLSRNQFPDNINKANPQQKILESEGPFSLLVGDVGNPSFWCDDVKKLMDKVDILVNSAGISHSALLPFAKDEHVSQILHTNLQGTIFACRTMVRRAIRQRRQKPGNSPDSRGANRTTKCIINISSLHASKGGVGVATYASTKAGVIALTRAIVAESNLPSSSSSSSDVGLGANLRVNVIVPGYVETRILDDLSDQFRKDTKLSIPLRRFGTGEEIADAAVFLATNQYANNCVLNIDGGLSAT